jgi:hypothetical protein
MDELELGQATIVYEDADGERTEETVDNEQLLYTRDHWVLRAGTDERGNDLMKQIPRQRVHVVNRSVERFEEEAATVRHRVEKLADELREKLPVDLGRDRRTHTERPPSTSTTVEIDPDESDESASEPDESAKEEGTYEEKAEEE